MLKKNKTDKKECPKCGSTNIVYIGISSLGSGVHSEYGKNQQGEKCHSFECNECHCVFDYCGEL